MFKGKDLSGIECQSIEAFRKHVIEAYAEKDPCKLPRLALEDATLIGCEVKKRSKTDFLVTGWAYVDRNQYDFTMIVQMEGFITKMRLFEAWPHGKMGVFYFRNGFWIFKPKDRQDERLCNVIREAFL